MNSDIRPLMANLKRLGISEYLITNEFENTLFEVNAEEAWKKFRRNYDNDNSFFQLIESFDNQTTTWDELKELVIPIVKDFIIWKNNPLDDYARLKESLQKIRVSQDTLDDLFNKNATNHSPKTQTGNLVENVIGESNNAIDKNIFVVHGTNKTARLELKEILKESFDLNPIILADKPLDNLSTIFSKLDTHARACSVAIILMTPDDVVNDTRQARANVILELGYFMDCFLQTIEK